MACLPRLQSNSISIAVCHSGKSDFFLGQLCNVISRVLQREQLPAVEHDDGIFKTGSAKIYSGNSADSGSASAGAITRVCGYTINVLLAAFGAMGFDL